MGSVNRHESIQLPPSSLARSAGVYKTPWVTRISVRGDQNIEKFPGRKNTRKIHFVLENVLFCREKEYLRA